MTQKPNAITHRSDEDEAEILARIAADPDNPEWTSEDFKNAKPFKEAFPELHANMKKNLGGRPKLANPKQAVSIRLSPEVIEHFKANGSGWQTRINEALEHFIKQAG